MHRHYLNKLWRLNPVLNNLGKKITNLLFKISKEPHHRLYTGQGGSPNLMDRSKYILDRLAQVYSTQLKWPRMVLIWLGKLGKRRAANRRNLRYKTIAI